MKFEIDYIEKLADIISAKGLTEISLEEGEQAITIRKDVIVSGTPVIAPAAPQVTQTNNQTEQTSQNTSASKGTPIVSPMVGTFYKAPSPDAEPFVSVGSTIKQGDVVCIVEAMKMMNEIKSEVAGRITEICVEDGQPVEFGQVMMYVE